MELVSWKRLASISVVALALTSLSCGRSLEPMPPETLETEGDTVPIPELTPAEKSELQQMVEPTLSVREQSVVLSRYAHIDPGHVIPDLLLQKALTYYDQNAAHIPNKDYLSVVDFKSRSTVARLYVINMASGHVWTLHVAHGSGSDPKRTGYATHFSNTPGSLMSSLGFYRTAETYVGKHGVSLRLDGLSSTNSNVRARAIVVHSANYVSDSNVVQGRSNGCLAVSLANKDRLLSQIKGGSIIYAGLSQ